MKLQFSKYHGAGNDFIMIDSRKNVMNDRSQKTIAALCDRHFGIGADGLIILEASENQDFRMDYYNSDGNPGTMCGNGGRCITKFASMCGWIGKTCTFEAADGLHSGEILEDGRVRLSLNNVLNVEKDPEGYMLDTGSPHLVIFVENTALTDVFTLGRKYRNEPRFPNGTNVNFVSVSGESITVRTYERGVEDETLSCGTGVTASAIAASLHSESIAPPVQVLTRGGKLEVGFTASEGKYTDISLTGGVKNVYDGKIEKTSNP